MDSESKKEIEELVKRQTNVLVPIMREGGSLVIEMWLPKTMNAKDGEDWNLSGKALNRRQLQWRWMQSSWTTTGRQSGVRSRFFIRGRFE